MKFLADENFNNAILRGTRQRTPDVVFIRVQDIDLAGADDLTILRFASEEGFILLSHDVNTMRGLFYELVATGQPVPALFLIHKQTPIGPVVDALELIILASDESEWVDQVSFIP
jgi:predicted nuclease of predicted toxin-antitoxin system